MERSITQILEVIIRNNNNKNLIAQDLGVSRTHCYRYLNQVRDLGLTDEEYNVEINESLLKIYTDIASEFIGEDRVDVKDNVIIIYNTTDYDNHWNKEDLRKDRGYYKEGIPANDIDIIVDLKINFITAEEFTELIFVNQQWLDWKLNKQEDNPFDYVDMQDVYKGIWRDKIRILKELKELQGI